MTEKWRRVGDELFNLSEDPGQRNNLAAENPEIMEKLGNAYEDWWKDITIRVDEYSRTIVGSDRQTEILLTCQAWHGEYVPYNQQHVRNAMEANGFWDLSIAKAGRYRIELRRWPKEADAALDELIEVYRADPARHNVNDRMGNRTVEPLEIVEARLKAGDIEKIQKVKPGQKEVVFELDLEAGDLNLQTWLKDNAGVERGSYFVYIRRNETQ
ncbi:hypothetical protein ACFLSP_04750 [Bacteroidota bacterium]